MNGQVVRALFQDALYQVLDNKVFRILASLVALFVALTFIIGAREEGLVLLFGFKELRYEEIFQFFGLPYRLEEIVDPSTGEVIGSTVAGGGEILIQNIQTILIDNLAGSLGIMFAVAATAFFVPRMLEKGAADTLFSKPVGRFTLLFSRYLAGLIFVAILATTLVGGMHVGFLLNSGYSDPGILWSILTLVYVFGLLHGVSILVGVLTRSTVAAILITLMFNVFTSCVHTGWQAKELFLADSQSGRIYSDQETAIEEALENEDQAEASPAEAADEEEEEEDDFWLDLFFTSLDTVHFVLPKTSDASAIARTMRDDWEHRYAELWDEEGGLLVTAAPPGWERTGGTEDLQSSGVVWSDPEGRGSLSLTRRPLDGTNRIHAAKDLRSELRGRSEVSEISSDRGRIARTTTSQVLWTEGTEGEQRRHRRNLFSGGSWLYSFEIEGELGWYEDAQTDQLVQEFASGVTFNAGENATDASTLFRRRLSWDGPLPYNIWFSIFSSLAFLGLVLGIAGWRLSRVDF